MRILRISFSEKITVKTEYYHGNGQWYKKILRMAFSRMIVVKTQKNFWPRQSKRLTSGIQGLWTWTEAFSVTKVAAGESLPGTSHNKSQTVNLFVVPACNQLSCSTK